MSPESGAHLSMNARGLSWREVEKRILEEQKNVLHRLRRWLRWSVWEHVVGSPRNLRWFIQRGRRGYADCDVWNIDSYLCSWLPQALERLAEDGSGYPAGRRPLNAQVLAEEDDERYFQEWKQMLRDMAFAFRIENAVLHVGSTDWLEIPDGEWTEEWYNQTIDRWTDFNNKWTTNIRPITREELDRYNQGWRYFREYFTSLWD